MKRICIGFFGFIRTPINRDIFNSFRSLLPDSCTIDIVISCPNKINEYDDIIINSSVILEDIRAACNGCNVYIDAYEYDPLIFIKKVQELGLPDYTTYPSYRVFSMHFSISRLCKNIINISLENHIHYDSIILTRFDIIPGVTSLGCLLNQVTEHAIYIWRRCPYVSDVHAEDRIIISSMSGVHALCNLYGFSVDSQFYTPLVSENIIGKYLHLCNNLILLPQDGISLNLPPSIHVKYSDASKNYLLQLLDRQATTHDNPI
jgi:hypothetical protein